MTAREYGEREFERFKKIFDPPMTLAHVVMYDAEDKIPAMFAIDTDYFTTKTKKMGLYSMLRDKARQYRAVAVVLVTESWATKDVDPSKGPMPRNVDIPKLAEMGYCRCADVMTVFAHTPLENWIVAQEFATRDGKLEWAGPIDSAGATPNPSFRIFEEGVVRA